MAKPLRIRQSKDTNVVHRLDAEIFDYNLTHAVATENTTWWIVYDGDEPIAYAGAVYLKDKNSVYLSRSGVTEDYRGYGLQRKLIQKRVKWAKDMGADCVVTYTDSDNIYSSNNLIKSGFLLYLPDFPWGSADDALYWKRTL
jgi:GNAT superfamily N-acetyltransferase